MRLIRVVPTPGMSIPNPETQFKPLPPEGDIVPYSLYWEQRKNEGGCSFADATEPQLEPTQIVAHNFEDQE